MRRPIRRTMTTLSTHDTKRSEDVRARLAVLSEVPAMFRATLTMARRTRAAAETDAEARRETRNIFSTRL